MAASYTAAVLVASLLLACWRPAPWTPPPPPEEARAALGLASPPDPAAPGPTPRADTEAPAVEAPSAPTATATMTTGTPWSALVTAVPATVVDDAGKAICVLHAEGTRVTVLATDAIRARIRHPDCPAEGWLQVTMVRRP